MNHDRNKHFFQGKLKKVSNTPELFVKALCQRVVNSKWKKVRDISYRTVAWMKCNGIRGNTTPDSAELHPGYNRL